jgi:hypothetical protein
MSRAMPVVSCVLTVVQLAGAQCAPQWHPVSAGVDGVRCTALWDPDGAGPLAQVLVVGGAFASVGTVAAANIAMRDLTTGAWAPLGAGTNGEVDEIVVLPSGELVAAGAFTVAGGVAANRIASWNGASWAPLAGGVGQGVAGLAVAASGQLVACGSSGGTSYVATWDGLGWSSLPSPVSPGQGSLRCVTTMPNGDVVAGSAGTLGGSTTLGTPASVTRWNGAAWTTIASFAPTQPLDYRAVTALAVDAAGNLLIAGRLGAFQALASWNGASVVMPNGSPAGTASSLLPLANGDVLVGGSFGSPAGSGPAVYRYNAGFTALAGLSGTASSLLELPAGHALAAGGLRIGGDAALAVWNGTTWQGVDQRPVPDATVRALAPLPGGGFVAGGEFTWVGGALVNGIATWNGTAWSGLGTGPSTSFNHTIVAVTVDATGAIVAGGATQGGPARWNGTSWSPLGPSLGSNVSIHCLTTTPAGDVVAGGTFTNAGGVGANCVVRWDGAAWHALGAGIGQPNPGWLAWVYAMATLPNGDLVVTGEFGTAGGSPAANIARWDGAAWHALGAGLAGRGHALAVLPNGDLVVGGSFPSAGGVAVNNIARWDGAAWHPLGAGLQQPIGTTLAVHALAALPDGDVVAGGHFALAGGVPARCIARWNGSSWSPLAAAIGAPVPHESKVHALSWTGDGLIAGGYLTSLDGVASPYVATLATPCAASTVLAGAGCAGSAGPNALAATALPWTGGTFAALGTGMPATSVAVAVYGFQPLAIPLASLLPQGQSGCSLLASPDVLLAALPSNGVLATLLAIPDVPALAGTTVHHQIAAVELGPTGALLAVTSTNALQLTIGSF